MRASGEACAKRSVVENATECRAEGFLVAAAHEEPGVADDFGDGAPGVAHDRCARGERFEGGEAEALEKCRVEEAFRAGVERGERRIVDEAGEDHAIARHMPIGERITQDRRELSESARDKKTQVPVATGPLTERTKNPPHLLPGIELADVEDVAVGHTEPLLRE